MDEQTKQKQRDRYGLNIVMLIPKYHPTATFVPFFNTQTKTVLLACSKCEQVRIVTPPVALT